MLYSIIMKLRLILGSCLLLLVSAFTLSACTAKDPAPQAFTNQPTEIPEQTASNITPTIVEQKADTSDQQLLDELMSDDASFDDDLKNLEVELSQ